MLLGNGHIKTKVALTKVESRGDILKDVSVFNKNWGKKYGTHLQSLLQLS
jgi:hypothetical protein